jgi:MFS family permease
VPVSIAFALLAGGGSVAGLGLVMAAQCVPLVIFLLFGGVWADRLPRQHLMLTCELLRASSQATSAGLLLSGRARIGELVVLQAVYGAASAFFIPARAALVSQAVREEDLQQANALLSLADNVVLTQTRLLSELCAGLAGVCITALALEYRRFLYVLHRRHLGAASDPWSPISTAMGA